MKRYIPQHTSRRKRVPTGRMIAVCILLIAAVATLSVGITLAKMVSTAHGSDSAQAAAFIVEANGGSGQTLTIDCAATSTTAEYSFTVTNTKDGKTAEVSMEYDVIVTLPEALPAGLTMTINGKEGTASAGNKTYTFSNVGTFSAGTNKTDSCTLTFTANAGEITQDYHLGAIDVSIHAEQVN